MLVWHYEVERYSVTREQESRAQQKQAFKSFHLAWQTWVSPFSSLHDGQNSCFRDHWPEVQDGERETKEGDRYRGIFSFSPTDIQTHRHTTLPTIPLPSVPPSTLPKYTWTGPAASTIMLGISIFLPYLDCNCAWKEPGYTKYRGSVVSTPARGPEFEPWLRNRQSWGDFSSSFQENAGIDPKIGHNCFFVHSAIRRCSWWRVFF